MKPRNNSVLRHNYTGETRVLKIGKELDELQTTTKNLELLFKDFMSYQRLDYF